MTPWRQLVRDVPDYPHTGIVFKDITPLLADPDSLDEALSAMAEPWRDEQIDRVVGIEARGFLVGAAVARELRAGLVVVRKAGKLPRRTLSASYDLEYGSDTLEMHADSLAPGQRAVILDDVLATGGTAAAATQLVTAAGADLAGCGFLLEIAALGGRARLGGVRVECAMTVSP